ncbi:MAG: DUF5686 family protein [Flavobacteriales bacterium]|jgi:hypothetical protein
MRLFCLLVVVFLNHTAVFAQMVSGRVTDVVSGEPLAFVAILEQGTSNGAYTDIDGYFTIRTPAAGARVRFQYVGYQPVSLTFGGQDPWLIKMSMIGMTAPEVVVRPGENPAERIMRKVIEARDRNNPERRTSFSYDSYNKLVFTADIDSLRKKQQYLSYEDSTTRSMERYFSDKHLFLMESASRRRFLPPDRSEEVILGNRVSGLKNPAFALLGTQIQSFSFYGETVNIMDLQYLSPLCDAAISKYLFILEDTTLVENDTVFTISFRPRKGKNFKGMNGQLFVHTNGYALQNVIAEPAEADASLRIRIQQQYQLTPAGWFPRQLNSFMRFPKMNLNGAEVVGFGKSYISNLSYDLNYRSRDFGPVVLMMAPDARTLSDSSWQALRTIPLDEKEENTYRTVDSLGRAQNFDKRFEKLLLLTTGKIPIGKLNFDLDRLTRFNDFEGLRLGGGVHTNEFLSRRFAAGGYYAYGFRDRAHKGGADLLVHIWRPRDVRFTISWQRDVMETGGRQLDPQRQFAFLTGDLYPLFISRMDQVEKSEITLSGRLIGNLSATTFFNLQDIRPFATDLLQSSTDAIVSVGLPDIALTESGITLRWAPGERLVRTSRGEVRLGGKYPVTHLRITQALDGVMGSTMSFTRYDAIIEKSFRFVHLGTLHVRLGGGLVPSDLPPSLLYNMRGSNNLDYEEGTFLGVVAQNTFETMRTNEFMHARYAALHIRHQFRDLLLSSGKFRPHLSIVHHMLIGDRAGESSFVIRAREARRPFLESGLVIDRLIVSNLTGVGVGLFYRYGEYALDLPRDNFIGKLSLAMSF